MSYLEELRKESSKVETENGAATYSTSFSKCLDFFALGAAKRNNVDQAVALFEDAYREDKLTALKILFYIRDVRGGQGERDIFRKCYQYLGLVDHNVGAKNLSLIPEYGRWDDLLEVGGFYEKEITEILVKQLAEDQRTNTPSLLAKWLPSENTSSKRTRMKAKEVREMLGLDSRSYRKLLSKLRIRIGLLEQKMSKNWWNKIDYSKLPSRAFATHTKAFARHTPDKLYDFFNDLKNGKVTINTHTLYPHEIIRKVEEDPIVAEGLWENLPDYAETSGIVVADVSGSMMGIPMQTSVALALYFAERAEGPFQNKFITFSNKPHLQEISGETLEEKCRSIMNADWEMNTNLEAVFDLLLQAAIKSEAKPEELPETIYIISDMEFDACVENSNETLYENAQRKWKKAGYKLPTVVFWNVNSRSNTNLPVVKDEIGVALVSGMSPTTFSIVVDGLTPLEIMQNVVSSDRYAAITI